VWAPCLEGSDTCGDTMVEAGRYRPAWMRSCLWGATAWYEHVFDTLPGTGICAMEVRIPRGGGARVGSLNGRWRRIGEW
jgi:hypothetical protein